MCDVSRGYYTKDKRPFKTLTKQEFLGITWILLDFFLWKASRISIVPDTEPVQLSARPSITLRIHKNP